MNLGMLTEFKKFIHVNTPASAVIAATTATAGLFSFL